MSVRKEDSESPETSSTDRGLGWGAAVGIGVGIGAALYYFFGRNTPDSSTQFQHTQPFIMDYSSDFNNSSDYITTTDTSINESETDASINVSDSESLESFEMDQHVELSIDEPEYDESSDDVVMSQTSDLDDFDEDNNDSNVYDSDSELLSTENDSDFDFVYHEDVISFEVSNVFDNQVPQSRNVLHDLSVNMHNLGPFRQRSNTLEQCSICFEVILRDEETMSLACTHMFHTKCVLPWLQRNQTCPNCRKRI